MWNTHQNSESLFLCPSVYVPLLKGIPVYRCLLWDIVGLVMFSVCFLNMETPSCLKTPPNELFMNTDVEHCLKRLNKEGKQMESNMKNAPLSKKASPLHTFTTKSNIFDTNLPQAACESSPKLTDRLQWNAASRLLFWQHLWQSEQSCNFPLSVSVLSLPANLPENPKLCWDMKCLLVPPFISRHYYLQHLQEVLENMKTKGWHAWAGEGRKCGSTEGRTLMLMRSGTKICCRPVAINNTGKSGLLRNDSCGPDTPGKGLWWCGDQHELLLQSRPGVKFWTIE